MTIVIAVRRGEEALLLADTLIGNRNAPRSDDIPGRLKVVAIGTHVTVAFAGDADPAHVAVREARTRLLKNGFDDALKVLIEHSATGSTDYIVASNLDRLSLLRIKNGVTIEIDDICAIGDQAPFQSLIDKHLVSPSNEPLTKCDLRYNFLDRLMTAKDLSNTIGGFPIVALASPGRHAYLHHSGFYTYDLPEIPPGETVEQSIDDVYSGRNHFMLSVLPSRRSGVPVVGACLLQARTGWVYSPMEDIEPFKIELAPAGSEWESFQQAMLNRLQAAIEEHVEAVTSP